MYKSYPDIPEVTSVARQQESLQVAAENSQGDMMNRRIAKFEKVSLSTFIRDAKLCFEPGSQPSDEELEKAWENISIPVRATRGSAGYDIRTPFPVRLMPGEGIRIPTGIRCRMSEDYFLMVVPKSGLGTKYRFQLDNTVGVVDSDYYYSDNEGQMFVPMRNDSRDGRILSLETGMAFAQCIFVSYGITEDDCAEGIRNGGFGSTETKKTPGHKLHTFLCVISFALLIIAALTVFTGCTSQKEVAALRQQALTSYYDGNYERAEKEFTKALEAGKGTVSELQYDILKYIADCQIRCKKFDKALETYIKLENTEYKNRNDDEAEKLRSMVSDLKDMEKLAVGVKLMENGEYDKALEIFSQYADLSGSLTGRAAWFDKAVCTEHMGQFELAYALLNEYLKAYPDDEDARRDMTFLKTR